MPTAATHVWRPSSARTLYLDSFIPVPRGSIAVAPPPLLWSAKDPADTLDYQFDISAAIVGNEGDGIANLDVSVSPSAPGDLTLQAASIDGATAVMWFFAGQAGTVYTITVTIATTNGRSIQRSLLLPVLSLSSPAAPATSLVTDTGLVLTDQNGNPVLAG